jgi:hypothetical protein
VIWEIILRDCTNVLTSAVSAFAQIPVPEALAIAGSADEHQRLHLDQSGRFWIEAWTDYVGDQPRAEWLPSAALGGFPMCPFPRRLSIAGKS